MKKWIRPVALVVIFLATIVVSAGFMNKTNEDLTASLEEATLPVVYFAYNGVTLNELHGYRDEMDICSMRNTITPLKDDRMLHVTVDTFGADIDSINYEIRNLDGTRLVAEGEISNYKQNGNKVTFDEQVESILDSNKEYMYRLCLRANGQNVYYYTRIEKPEGRNVEECIDFAETFHEKTLNGEGDRFIPTYMDPATGDPTTLSYVDLSCTLKQLTWADFKGEVITDVIASVLEINDIYNVITIDYVMSYVNEAGETEYYNVNEYFRLRKAETRIYALNFERRMNQIFRGENEILTSSGDLQLGIRDENVNYLANESGSVIAFVQEGELWCYDSTVNNIARVFSFRSVEGVDPRENWDEHDIKIVSVDEAGSVNFIVYGYMNRGKHEGEVGVGVYHYDGLSRTIEEEVFIPSDKSFQVLKADLGERLYVNEMDQLFLVMAGNMYKIDLISKTATTMITGLSEKCYAASESGRYFAWIDPEHVNDADSITFIDLKDLSETEIKEGAGRCVRPLGFIDEDFIYGIASKSDILTDEGGNTYFAMNSLKIMEMTDTELEVVKNYTPVTGYISGIRVEDYIIGVELQKLVGNRYVAIEGDSIMDRNADTQENVLITTSYEDVKETMVQLVLKNVKRKDIKMVTSMLLLSEVDTRLELDQGTVDQRYYVYARGQVVLMTDNLVEAVNAANDSIGVVVNQNQLYVWNRARDSYKNPFTGLKPSEADAEAGSMAACVSAMLMREGVETDVQHQVSNGTTYKTVLETNLPDHLVIDATGCTLEQALFYVNEGSPVLTYLESGRAVLLTGYTAKVVYYYDPLTRQTSSMDIQSITASIENSGNIFITYLEK